MVPAEDIIVIKVVGWEELKLRDPVVAVLDVPVTCGKAVEIDLAIDPSAVTPF